MKSIFTFVLILLLSISIVEAQITSAGSGYWNSSATWTDGSVPTATDNVVISAGNSVTINIPNAECKDITIDGTLAFPDTTALGITINGSLVINATGYFNTHNTNSPLAPRAQTITLYKDLTVASGGRIDFRRGSGANVGVGRLVFAGTDNSTISLSQTVYASTLEEFNSVVINKTDGAKVVLASGNLFQNNNSTNSADTLLLISGIIETGNNHWVHLATSANAVIGASSASYVNGILGRGLSNSAGATRRIDVGDSSGYRPITIQTTVSGAATGHYVWAKVIKGNANTGSSAFTGDIDKVSALRYYQVGYVMGGGAAQMSFARFNPSYRDNDGVTAGNTDLRIAYSSDSRATWNGIGPSTDTTSLATLPKTIISDSLSPVLVIANGASINVALARKSGTTTNSLDTAGTLSVNRSFMNVPNEFTLHQNYPNPFNPSTVISYQLPVNSFATLKIYDMIGREVATLVNEQQSAGRYSVQFSVNSHQLSSGIYFYKLQAGNFIETKKMLMMK